ncbi:MAG: YraN family protein [Burkholderiales bacterium]|nr:YraN family protein [Burkholderiales bacterium]
MWFSRKQAVKVAPESAASGAAALPKQSTTKSRGDAAEAAALAYLVGAGLRRIEANYRTPGRGGGEIDLVMRAPDGTLVFVEVRQRTNASHGGAGASISTVKQRRIIFAARHYLMRFASLPPCRFDVVLVHGALSGCEMPPATIEWLPAAFDAS